MASGAGAFVEGFVRGSELRSRRRDREEERALRREENDRRRREFEMRERESRAREDELAYQRDTREGLARAGQGLPPRAPVETRAIPTDAAPAPEAPTAAIATEAVTTPVQPEPVAPARAIAVDEPAAAPAAAPEMPAAANPAAAPAQAISTQAPRRAPANPNADTAKLLFDQARYLVTRGEPQRAQALFDQADKLEQQGLERAMRRADAQYATTRDPRVYVDIYNSMVPDGGKIVAMEPAGDGQWRIDLEADGRGQGSKVIPQAELEKMILEMRDPAAMRAIRAARIKSDIEKERELELIKARGEETRKNYQVLNEGRENVARIRASAVLSRGGGGGGSSGGDNVQSTKTLADGTLLIIRRSGKRELVTDDNGQPVVGSEATRIAAQIYRQIAQDPLNRDPDRAGTARRVVSDLGRTGAITIGGVETGRPPAAAPAATPPANRRPIDTFGR